jgi:hypothetical protein
MKKLLVIFAVAALMTTGVNAGNPDRAGQAGATQLLINGWARNTGFNGINIGSCYGIESVINNPAGLATTRRTELVFSHTRWLTDAGIGINNFGFSQALKKAGVIGIYVSAFDLGEFIRTTEDHPEGDLGTFSPTYMNLGFSYAKKFTDHIYVGMTMKAVHESIYDVAANGLAFDAGVQYRTNLGSKDSLHADKLKIGISLRNIGTTMKYGGDGLSFRTNRDEDFTSLAARPSAEFEMPSVLNMGISYDFYPGDDHRLTALGAFISNTFSHDQLGVGFEYSFKDILMVRYSFLYEEDILSKEDRMTAFTGHAMGASVEIPFKSSKNTKSKFGLDYSYRSSNPFSGVHCIGARIDL